MRPPISSSWTLQIRREGKFEQQHQLAGHVQGQDALILHHDIVLQQKKEASSINDVNGSPAQQLVELEFVDEASGIVLQGGGPLEYGVQSMISIGDLAAGEAGTHAVTEVELCSVPYTSVENRPTWDASDQETFAATLGYAFGLKLVENVTVVSMPRYGCLRLPKDGYCCLREPTSA
jgi:hypothetical protein